MTEMQQVHAGKNELNERVQQAETRTRIKGERKEKGKVEQLKYNRSKGSARLL